MEFPEPEFDEKTLKLIEEELNIEQLERSECFNTFNDTLNVFNNQDVLQCDPNKYNIHTVLSTYCPLGCKGCYQTELSQKKVLDKDLAWKRIKEILEFIYNDIPWMYHNPFTNKDRILPRVNLTFFGGEPILQMETIIYILNKLRSEMNEDYMMVNAICIPTSGFANNLDHNILLDKIDIIASLVKDLKLDCNISISHDGLNNKELRNIDPEKVSELIRILQRKAVEHDWNLISDRISLVIPQKFDTNYFIDNHDYILNKTGLQPSFTIPHTIDKDSTFRTNPEIFKEALEKFIFKYQEKFKAWQSGTIYDPSCCSSERMYTSTSNELPTLFEGILSKMYSSPYNWCGAGVNHFTIQTDGSYTNCEYIKTSSEEFLETIKEKCKNCEIKNYCQKPCIKNFEEGHKDSLEVQCTIRKILFNEVRKTLK